MIRMLSFCSHPKVSQVSSRPLRRGGTTASGYAASLVKPDSRDCLTMNGIYFGYGGTGGRFQPAGRLVIYQGLKEWPIIIPSTVDPDLDPNLAVRVGYNAVSNTVSLSKYKKIIRGTRFYSWPMIVSGGVVNPLLTQPISHRARRHYRTFLIQRANEKAVFGITTQRMTLTDLGTRLTNLFAPETISVVNLDGGSSTSLRHSSYTFNAVKTLPSFFGMCGR